MSETPSREPLPLRLSHTGAETLPFVIAFGLVVLQMVRASGMVVPAPAGPLLMLLWISLLAGGLALLAAHTPKLDQCEACQKGKPRRTAEVVYLAGHPALAGSCRSHWRPGPARGVLRGGCPYIGGAVGTGLLYSLPLIVLVRGLGQAMAKEERASQAA